MASGPRGAEAMLFLLLMAVIGALGLWIAVRLARRARRPKVRKPPRRTFEHGRRLGRERGARTMAAALAALKASPVGAVRSQSVQDRRVDVLVHRKKSQPCEQVAGYLAGVLESAWAHEVLVTHSSCAGPKGGDCLYTVQRAPLSIKRSADRTERASIPGSAAAPRRSQQARPGGG